MCKENSMVETARKTDTHLTGVAQWTECRPVNQRVASLIPRQGACLGYGPGPQ